MSVFFQLHIIGSDIQESLGIFRSRGLAFPARLTESSLLRPSSLFDRGISPLNFTRNYHHFVVKNTVWSK